MSSHIILSCLVQYSPLKRFLLHFSHNFHSNLSCYILSSRWKLCQNVREFITHRLVLFLIFGKSPLFIEKGLIVTWQGLPCNIKFLTKKNYFFSSCLTFFIIETSNDFFFLLFNNYQKTGNTKVGKKLFLLKTGIKSNFLNESLKSK